MLSIRWIRLVDLTHKLSEGNMPFIPYIKSYPVPFFSDAIFLGSKIPWHDQLNCFALEEWHNIYIGRHAIMFSTVSLILLSRYLSEIWGRIEIEKIDLLNPNTVFLKSECDKIYRSCYVFNNLPVFSILDVSH